MTENQKTFSGGEPVIRLIGLGETGVKLVETLAMIGPEGVESHSLDTDNRSLSRCHQSKTLLLGQAIPCGLGTGGDVALARAAVESDRDRLAKLVESTLIDLAVAKEPRGNDNVRCPGIDPFGRVVGRDAAADLQPTWPCGECLACGIVVSLTQLDDVATA